MPSIIYVVGDSTRKALGDVSPEDLPEPRVAFVLFDDATKVAPSRDEIGIPHPIGQIEGDREHLEYICSRFAYLRIGPRRGGVVVFRHDEHLDEYIKQHVEPWTGEYSNMFFFWLHERLCRRQYDQPAPVSRGLGSRLARRSGATLGATGERGDAKPR
jgi:hypothetical protein